MPDWIEHDGGPCPVSPETRVDVRWCNEPPEKSYVASCLAPSRADCVSGWETSVTHYRIISEPKAEPEKFQHVSVAAYAEIANDRFAVWNRSEFKKVNSYRGTVLRTVAKWEALERRTHNPDVVPLQDFVELNASLDAALDEIARLKTELASLKPAPIQPLAAPAPRDTTWPAPAHRPRWIPYT